MRWMYFTYGINFSAIAGILFFVGYTNTDKSVLIFLVFYPLLVLLNLLLFLVVKKPRKPVVKKILLVELLLLFPLLVVCVYAL